MIEITYRPETHVSGLLTLITVLFGFFFASVVLLKWIRSKEKILIYFSICIILTLSPWFSIATGYVYYVITGEELLYHLHIILNIVFLPILIFTWLEIYDSALQLKRKKLIYLIYAILSISSEIYMFYFLYFAPGAPIEDLLGSIHELMITYSGYLIVYSIILVITMVGTGIHFSMFSIKKAINKEMKLKGKILLVAFVLLGIQLILDVTILNTLLVFIIILRILLFISIFLIYIGFLMPNWIKKIILKE